MAILYFLPQCTCTYIVLASTHCVHHTCAPTLKPCVYTSFVSAHAPACVYTLMNTCIYVCILAYVPSPHTLPHTQTHTHTTHTMRTHHTSTHNMTGESLSSHSIRLLPCTSRPLTKLIRLAPTRNCVREVKVGKKTLQAERTGDGKCWWHGREMRELCGSTMTFEMT